MDDPLVSGEFIWRGFILLVMVGAGVAILWFRRTGADGQGWRTRLERMRGREVAVSDQGWMAAYAAGWRYLELAGWLALAVGFIALIPVPINVVTAWLLLGAGLVLFMVVAGLMRSFWAARATPLTR